MNRLNDEWFSSKSESVPLWHKIALSIDEMYVYTGIGRETIREVFQEAGGQLERSEIRDRISELDEHIAEFEQKLYTSNKTGNQYKKFDFKFNFAIKELSYVGLICHLPSVCRCMNTFKYQE